MAKIKGRDRMRQVLKAIPGELRKQLRVAVIKGAEDIAQMQRNLAPVKSGKLRDSIKVTPGDQNAPAYASLRSKRANPDPELAAIITAGNTDVRYAHLVEFGTAPHESGGVFEGADHPGSRAAPFFYPGFRARKKAAQAAINKAARKAIKDGLK